MADLICEVEKILRVDEAQTVTVGERFALKCSGATPAFDPKTTELRLDAAEKYKLKLLRLEQPRPSELRLEVLSDQVGQHALKAVQLVDHEQSVVLPEIRFEVKSVQDPKQPVQEPFASMGPFGIRIPMMFWVVLAVLIGLAVSLVFAKVVLKARRKKDLAQALGEATGALPDSELYLQLRRIRTGAFSHLSADAQIDSAQAHEVVEKLNSVFLLFMARHTQIPFSVWPLAKSLKVLTREKKNWNEETQVAVNKLLRELERSRGAKILVRDLHQLVDWIYQVADKVSRAEELHGK